MIIDNAKINRNELRGKVAVVTGSGRGIGRETARVLAYLGASVVIAELRKTGLDTEILIKKEGGGEALFVKTDVSDVEDMENLYRKSIEKFGKVDILVNNAAMTGPVKPVLELSVEEWDGFFAVNLRGAFLGIKNFLPDMLKRKEGIIIIFLSAEGLSYVAPYSASKTGLRSLTKSIALEIAADSGVSIYSYAPGIVETPGLIDSFKKLSNYYGTTLEVFVKMLGVPFISAELCATGLVGTILHAKEFHGKETNFFEGLTKLGLDGQGNRISE
ncbi:MAG: SDR family NAD(P)-dependent oxidoreductase [Candidatus Lokiarchaeia archaeon]